MGASATQPTIIPPRAMIKTGTYTGNGAGRTIAIGVDLTAKNNVRVMVGTVDVGIGQPSVWRTQHHQANQCTPYNQGPSGVTGGITGFVATGFTLGTHSYVNSNGYEYGYTVLWEEP